MAWKARFNGSRSLSQHALEKHTSNWCPIPWELIFSIWASSNPKLLREYVAFHVSKQTKSKKNSTLGWFSRKEWMAFLSCRSWPLLMVWDKRYKRLWHPSHDQFPAPKCFAPSTSAPSRGVATPPPPSRRRRRLGSPPHSRLLTNRKMGYAN